MSVFLCFFSKYRYTLFRRSSSVRGPTILPLRSSLSSSTVKSLCPVVHLTTSDLILEAASKILFFFMMFLLNRLGVPPPEELDFTLILSAEPNFIIAFCAFFLWTPLWDEAWLEFRLLEWDYTEFVLLFCSEFSGLATRLGFFFSLISFVSCRLDMLLFNISESSLPD